MTAVAPSPAGEQGWRKVIVAMIVMLLVPIVPPFRALVPIQEPLLLIVPALAVCTLLGWGSGGPLLAALLWCGVAAVVLARPSQAGSVARYHDLTRGWALLVAGGFGAVGLLMGKRTFFVRAVLTVSIALGVALMVSVSRTSGFEEARRAVRTQFAMRNESYIRPLRQVVQSPPPQLREFMARHGVNAQMVDVTDEQLRATSRFAVIAFPALLLLQTIAALGIAWSLYHRLNRSRIGAPLTPIRQFRFNDQLVWGLVVGLAIAFPDRLSSVRGLGINLLVFFGMLYSLRGLGVFLWFLSQLGPKLALMAGVLLVLTPLIGASAMLTVISLMLVLGLGDTWMDWRKAEGRAT